MTVKIENDKLIVDMSNVRVDEMFDLVLNTFHPTELCELVDKLVEHVNKHPQLQE